MELLGLYAPSYLHSFELRSTVRIWWPHKSEINVPLTLTVWKNGGPWTARPNLSIPRQSLHSNSLLKEKYVRYRGCHQRHKTGSQSFMKYTCFPPERNCILLKTREVKHTSDYIHFLYILAVSPRTPIVVIAYTSEQKSATRPIPKFLITTGILTGI